MCFSCSSISYWMEKPIQPSEEKWKPLGITLVVLAIIGQGFLSYYYGRFPEWYNHGYAYFSFGVAGCILLGATTAYIARAIISRRKMNEHVDESVDRYIKHVDTFFPDKPLKELSKIPVKLWDYSDDPQAAVLAPHFTEGRNIIRAVHEGGLPFVGLCVSIGEGTDKAKAILAVAPDCNGNWKVGGTSNIEAHIWPWIQEDTSQAAACIDWLKAILRGEKRPLLPSRFEEQTEGPLTEGPLVALWQD